jgi:hypothetical protein
VWWSLHGCAVWKLTVVQHTQSLIQHCYMQITFGQYICIPGRRSDCGFVMSILCVNFYCCCILLCILNLQNMEWFWPLLQDYDSLHEQFLLHYLLILLICHRVMKLIFEMLAELVAWNVCVSLQKIISVVSVSRFFWMIQCVFQMIQTYKHHSTGRTIQNKIIWTRKFSDNDRFSFHQDSILDRFYYTNFNSVSLSTNAKG